MNTGKVSCIRFNIDIANEVYLSYYSGEAQSISVETDDGQRVEFLAMHLREFVSHSGVQGYFELCFDAQNRFQSIRRIY